MYIIYILIYILPFIWFIKLVPFGPRSRRLTCTSSGRQGCRQRGGEVPGERPENEIRVVGCRGNPTEKNLKIPIELTECCCRQVVQHGLRSACEKTALLIKLVYYSDNLDSLLDCSFMMDF